MPTIEYFRTGGRSVELDKSKLDNELFDIYSRTNKNEYLYMCNVKNDVARWSKNAVDYFGLPGEYFDNPAMTWASHIHPDDVEAYIQDITDVFSGVKEIHKLEYRARNKDGEYVLCSCMGLITRDENGELDIFAGTLTNHGIVDNVDANTSLYNIYQFFKMCRYITETKMPAGILMFGINNFKQINDIYGYDFGNSVIKGFANEARNLITKKNMGLFRMDGVQFSIMYDKMTPEDAKSLYEKLQDIARKGITVQGMNISFSLSGGAVFIDDFSINEHTIMAYCSYVLECSKKEKHGELVFFENEASNDSKRNIELINAIRQSVIHDCEGFYLNYQPLINEKTGKVKGMEALLRWRNEKYGEVSPGIFIPWLENDTCFYELGNWIFKQAMTDAKPIVEKDSEFILDVNVAYTQIERAGFRYALLNIIREVGYPPENLCIELTERCRNLNTEFLKEELKFFRSHGLKVALDDFGTGVSSLNLLRVLPVDSLKIDQSFIFNIRESKIDQTIVESVINCAKQLGIKICIEGVENQEISDFLKSYKADTHQGYYYSRPVSIETVESMLGKVVI